MGQELKKGGIASHADSFSVSKTLKPRPAAGFTFLAGGRASIPLMIRIVIADQLDAKAIDSLNEISEFEIIEKPSLASAQLAEEIKSADAVIVSGALDLGKEVLKRGSNLKLIVRSDGPGRVDTQAAQRHGIEIRAVAAGSEAIAILKDFFNV